MDKLFSVSVVPLCSPRLLEGKHPLRQPKDLRYHTLIHDTTAYQGRPGWRAWLKAAGVEGMDATRDLHFNHLSLALEAAIDAQGVVLSLKPLTADDLAAGHLVIPFDLSLSMEYAYYVICPKAAAERPEITAFREWLLGEAKRQEDSDSSHLHHPEISNGANSFNYCCILIGAAPLKFTDQEKRYAYACRAARLNALAGDHFNRGLRAYYFGLAVLTWFVNA